MRTITSLILLFLVSGCTHKELAVDASTSSIYECKVNPYQLDIKILATNPGSAVDEAVYIANRLHLTDFSVYCAQEVEDVRGQE